jgi:uncharacterized protein (TIGR02687 family)
MTDATSLRAHLERRFSDWTASERCIVFWHDQTGEHSDELGEMSLPGVTTLSVANNEYAIKHRLLRLEPSQNFLIYRVGPVPEGMGNWLLDLELAYGVFTADRASLLRDELGLEGEVLREVVTDHEKFFRATKRTQALKSLLDPADDATRVRAKMCAVLLGQKEHSHLELTRALLVENAAGGTAKLDALRDHGLDAFHWEGARRIYRYESTTPSIDDFVLWMFRLALAGFRFETPGELRNIQLDFGSLRYDVRSQKAMAALARRAATDLDAANEIAGLELRDLVDVDLFEEIDQRIISDLARGIADRTLPARDVAEVVRQRQTSFWYADYQQLYVALASAADLLVELDALDVKIYSFDEGLTSYLRRWYRIDQLYRHFSHAARLAEYKGPLEGLRARLDALYANKFLYALGGAWQQQVDSVDRWQSSALVPQTAFFKTFVEPVIRDGKRKAVVIISDALRYEIADELMSRVRQEKGLEAKLDAVLGVLPSYTQLGMAALLPHQSIGHSQDGDPVLVDDQPSQGTPNRTKLLERVGGLALQAEQLLSMTREEIRELRRQCQVLYVYHNRIDAVGDKVVTERQVFGAVSETLGELVDIVKRLASADASTIFVTADHGFLFQDVELDKAGFVSTAPQADEIVSASRRYALGRGFKRTDAFATFTPQQLGLDSDLEVQIPKSVLRLRSGGGTRFVHGGAALQEVVVPVLAINRTRADDVRLVNVEILPESDKITTGQLVVKLFQSEPVSDKVKPRTVRASLYVGETLISNRVTLVFNQDSADKRDRYQSAAMLLSQDANNFNDRTVEFRLEEQIPNTTQWRTYAKTVYTLKRSFVTDF